MTDERTLRLLEFARIRENVAGYCLSEEGRGALLEEFPLLDGALVADLKAKVSALIGLFQEGREIPSLSFPDIARAAKAAAGIFGVHLLVNVGMVAGALPNKGMVLPFFSAGGSSTLSFFLALGLIMGILHRSRVK